MGGLQTIPESNVLYRAWTVANPQACLLLVHGMGAHSARWEALAAYFTGKNFSSYAIELKGFGATPERPRGHISSFNIYYQDILKLLSLIKKENPDKKVFIVGESMGGLISFILSCLNPDKFSGQVLISPAFKNGMKFPPASYLTLLTNFLTNSQKVIDMPFTSAMCTRDSDYQKVMDNNPDELRVASVKILLEILVAQMRAGALLKKLSVPTLFLLAGKDYLVDAEASRKTFSRLPLIDKLILEYPTMHHALSIELEKETVYNDVHEWIKRRI